MKKLLSLFLIGFLVLGGVAFAEVQIDEGQNKDRAGGKVIFFIGRYARTNAIGTNGNMISKDRVVAWDKVSNDGVTVDYTTTSNDTMVAGIAMDNIPGSSRDNTAAADLVNQNWGRIQTWGKYAAVSWDQSLVGGAAQVVPVGTLVGSSTKAGTVGMFLKASADTTRAAVSTDSIGFLLASPAASDKTADIFINRG